MSKKKPENDPRGTPCLVCNERFVFNNPQHLGTHFGDQSTAYDEYKHWVAEEFELDPDHPRLHDGTLLASYKFWEHSELFGY